MDIFSQMEKNRLIMKIILKSVLFGTALVKLKCVDDLIAIFLLEMYVHFDKRSLNI